MLNPSGQMNREIHFLLNTRSKAGGGISLSPDQIGRLPAAVYQSLHATLGQLGITLNFELRFRFYKMIRERPRNAEYTQSRSTHLWDRMQPAFRYEVTGTGSSGGATTGTGSGGKLNLNAFDLGYVDKETRGEGFGTRNKGWFMRFADGHQGRKHVSVEWGFARHRFVMDLAMEASSLIGDAAKRDMWLREMDTVFLGRHGEGIMVRLDEPMFAILPQFGKAGQFVTQHPGFYSWPAIGQVGQEMTRRRGYVGDMIQAAFDNAVKGL